MALMLTYYERMKENMSFWEKKYPICDFSRTIYIYILNFVCVSVAQLLPKASNDIGLKASDRLTYRLTEWFIALHFAAKNVSFAKLSLDYL